MIKVERQYLINYIKDNIDTHLASTDIELNLKEHNEDVSLELRAIDCEMGTLGLNYIEEYLLDHEGSELSLSCGIQTYGGFKYWARFEEPDEDNEDYLHLVQAEGNTLGGLLER